MPRLTRALKGARKAKVEALKASEASTNGNNNDNTVSTSNSSPCGSSSHLVASGGETRVLAAGESNHENVTKSYASEVEQDKRPGKSTAELGKERSDGGECGAGEHKHQKVTEVNAFTVVQDKRAERSRAEIEDRSGGGERGPSHNSGEEETVSLWPSQLVSKQKQRVENSSFAGNKGFRQDFNGRNSTASQNCVGYNSRQGGQHGYYQNRWSGRGGYNGSDSKRIDALGRAFGEWAEERGDDDDALLERAMSQVYMSSLLPSSAGAQSHHEDRQPSGAAATMSPTTLSEAPTTLVDPDWQEGDPVGTQGWRDFVSNVITWMITYTGTQRPLYDSHGLQHNAGRHKDIFEPVAQLRAELEALRAEVEQRGILEEHLHLENFELRSEVARLGSIIEGIEMMCGSRSHS